MSGDVFCEVLAGLDQGAGIDEGLFSLDQIRESEYAGTNKTDELGNGFCRRD